MESKINPNYYRKGRMELMDIMKELMTPEEVSGFLKGNIFKYVYRYEEKNGIEDLQKAEWYMGQLIKHYAMEQVKAHRESLKK